MKDPYRFDRFVLLGCLVRQSDVVRKLKFFETDIFVKFQKGGSNTFTWWKAKKNWLHWWRSGLSDCLVSFFYWVLWAETPYRTMLCVVFRYCLKRLRYRPPLPLFTAWNAARVLFHIHFLWGRGVVTPIPQRPATNLWRCPWVNVRYFEPFKKAVETSENL